MKSENLMPEENFGEQTKKDEKLQEEKPYIDELMDEAEKEMIPRSKEEWIKAGRGGVSRTKIREWEKMIKYENLSEKQDKIGDKQDQKYNEAVCYEKEETEKATKKIYQKSKEKWIELGGGGVPVEEIREWEKKWKKEAEETTSIEGAEMVIKMHRQLMEIYLISETLAKTAENYKELVVALNYYKAAGVSLEELPPVYKDIQKIIDNPEMVKDSVKTSEILDKIGVTTGESEDIKERIASDTIDMTWFMKHYDSEEYEMNQKSRKEFEIMVGKSLSKVTKKELDNLEIAMEKHKKEYLEYLDNYFGVAENNKETKINDEVLKKIQEEMKIMEKE